MARHGTAQHSTAQHSTAQHSTAQHSTAQHSTAQHSTAQHSTAQHSTAQHRLMLQGCYGCVLWSPLQHWATGLKRIILVALISCTVHPRNHRLSASVSTSMTVTLRLLSPFSQAIGRALLKAQRLLWQGRHGSACKALQLLQPLCCKPTIPQCTVCPVYRMSRLICLDHH